MSFPLSTITPMNTSPTRAHARRRGAFATVFAVLAALTLSACGASTTPTKSFDQLAGTPKELAAYYGQTLKWTDCKNGFECSTLTVPLDYNNPSGETLSLNVNRLLSTDLKGAPLGSIVVNPGGPGGSGIGMARNIGPVMENRLRDKYDIVGLDPRGVGVDSDVRCFTDEELDTALEIDYTPDTAAEIQILADLNAQFAKLCSERIPHYMSTMTTTDLARDLDILRAALGDEKLNWLGKSYGTTLGLTYAAVFPDRVGRFVLDGVLSPDEGSATITTLQAAGFEAALTRFAELCVSRGSCPIGSTPTEITSKLRSFLDKLDAKPMLVGQRKLTESLAIAGIVGSMYNINGSVESLPRILAAAYAGDGAPLLGEADGYNTRDESGHYGNFNDLSYIVTCPSRPGIETLEQMTAHAKVEAARNPVFGSFMVWTYEPCLHWPNRPETVPVPDPAKMVPFLIVSTSDDPVTPLAEATALNQLYPNARLVIMEAGFHTAYRSGNACVNKMVDDFFIQGSLPETTVSCGPIDATGQDKAPVVTESVDDTAVGPWTKREKPANSGN